MNGERSTADHNRANDPGWRKVAGAVRRFVVTLAQGGRWQLRGFRALRELIADVEVFQGIGLFARAPAGVEVEAIVVNLGDSDGPVVIALRDERTRAAVAAALAADTTVLHNSVVGAYLTPAGLVELRGHAGVAVPPALLSELAAIKTAITAVTPATDLASAITAVNAIRTAFVAWSLAGAARVRVE